MDTLHRFVEAQQDTYTTALAELEAGRKTSHWMWYIFPQLRGLGHSETARYYGIACLEEAQAYLDHPLLGPRLTRCCGAILSHSGRDPAGILGDIDALKLRSCATLFDALPEAPPVFDEVLAAFYGGERCPRTQSMLA